MTSLDKNSLEKTGSDFTKAAPFVLSRDPGRAMQEMMSAIDALRTIYVEENEALASSDTRRFLGLQDRKITLARNYQHGAEQMLERREEFKAADPALKTRLRAMQQDFSSLASENLGALDRMRRTVRRLNDRIMNMARENLRRENAHYGAAGRLKLNEKRLSIGLNESV